MRIKRKSVDLLEPHRLVSVNHLHEEQGRWIATGFDPYLCFAVGDQWFVGAWMVELVVDEVAGIVRPRIYLHHRRGFSEQASSVMRRVETDRFKLAFAVPHRCRMIRLDPVEFENCGFRFVSFRVRPISLATFFARASRNGENRTDRVIRSMRPVISAMREITGRRAAFETSRNHNGAQAGHNGSRGGAGYADWIAKFEAPNPEAELADRLQQLEEQPLISVLMPVYNTPKEYLDAAIASVTDQLYQNWELCIADDASTEPWVRPTLERWQKADSRIKVVFRQTNGHISEATNSAFSLASGKWVALLDHDDVLARNALAEVVLAIAAEPKAEIVYTDEDKIDGAGRRSKPFFKPDWSYDLFTGQNYLNHLTVHRADNIRKVGGWRKGFEGSQDYDLNLRIIEQIDQSGIVHVPKVLYHWRTARGSVAADEDAKVWAYDAGYRALVEHVDRLKIDAEVVSVRQRQYYRIKRRIPKRPPLVSLIIPTRDKADVLKVCIDSILAKTDYPRYEILIVDNNSVEQQTFDYFESLSAHANIRILRDERPFNYSAINNAAVKKAKGEIIGLINNDIEVISPDWLSEMVSHAVRPEIGCVGAKLYYPNDTIQHAGVILGVGGVAGHSHKYSDRDAPGYFGRLMLVQNLSAVTAACLLVRKEVYKAVGGLDEDNLAVAFNDVDFCLRVRQLGLLNLWTPFAELYHHESVSRGTDNAPDVIERFQREIFYMKRRWGDLLERDAYYSVNLTLDSEDFSLAR